MHARLVELSSEGLSAPRIHRKYPEIPLSTVRRTLKAYPIGTDDFTTKPRSGRPRALTEEQRDHIYRYDVTNHTNPHIKMRDLLREVNEDCKKRCLQGLLRSLNQRKWMQKKRPFITAAHAKARLDWAIRHQAYAINDWMRVSWSDECTVERGVGIQPKCTFVRPPDQVREGDIQGFGRRERG
jgi:hypothetical protein